MLKIQTDSCWKIKENDYFFVSASFQTHHKHQQREQRKNDERKNFLLKNGKIYCSRKPHKIEKSAELIKKENITVGWKMRNGKNSICYRDATMMMMKYIFRVSPSLLHSASLFSFSFIRNLS